MRSTGRSATARRRDPASTSRGRHRRSRGRGSLLTCRQAGRPCVRACRPRRRCSVWAVKLVCRLAALLRIGQPWCSADVVAGQCPYCRRCTGWPWPPSRQVVALAMLGGLQVAGVNRVGGGLPDERDGPIGVAWSFWPVMGATGAEWNGDRDNIVNGDRAVRAEVR